MTDIAAPSIPTPQTLSDGPVAPIAGVLLDVDGTLVDTAAILIRSLRHTLKLHLGGEYPDEELRNLLGRPLQKQMEHYSAERAPEMAAEFLRFYEEHQAEEHSFEEALTILSWIRSAGIKVCLVTSKTALEMEITGGRFPGLRNVDAMVTSDRTVKVKPHPEPALLALQEIGVPASQAIMVGDSPYDMECGHEAGVRTAAALWGPFPRRMLEPFHPDYWLSTPEDLRRLILTSSQGIG